MLKLDLRILVALALCLCSARGLAAERRALLMQVGHYPGRDVPAIMDFEAPQADVPEMRSVLESPKYHFVTTELVDAKATKQGILAALDRLAIESGPNDTVVVYFSGHGARDRNEFSICPWDAQRLDESHDVMEADLRAWLKKLRTNNVTLILDCCFSTVAARGARSLPKFAKFMGRDPGGQMISNIQIKLPKEKTVLLTAAAQNEVAQEVGLDGKWYGPFTYYLCKNLRKATAETTYSQLIALVQRDVSQWSRAERVQKDYVQTPSIFATPELANRPLFAPVMVRQIAVDPPKPVKPYVLVSRVANSKVYLDAGTEADVIKGAEYAVYPEGEKEFAGQALATIRVDTVNAREAVASVVPPGDASKVTGQCRASLTLYPKKIDTPDPVRNDSASAALTMHVEGPADVTGPFEEALKSVKGFAIAGKKDANPQVVLLVKKDGEGLTCAINAADGKTAVDDKRRACTGKTPAELADRVTHVLNVYATLHALALMRNPNPAFNLTIRSSKPMYVADVDKARFTLKSDQDCYFFLIDVDALGVPTLMWPRPDHADNRLAANEEKDFGDFPVSPPVGKETLLALATRDEAQAKDLMEALFKDLSIDPPAPVVGARRILPPDKLQEIQKMPLDMWTTAILDIQTLAKEATAPAVTDAQGPTRHAVAAAIPNHR